MEDKDLLDVYSAVSSFKGTENLFLDEEDFVEQINNNPDDVYEAISSFEGTTNLFLDKEDFYTQTGLKKNESQKQQQPQNEAITEGSQTVAEPLQESGGETEQDVTPKTKGGEVDYNAVKYGVKTPKKDEAGFGTAIWNSLVNGYTNTVEATSDLVLGAIGYMLPEAAGAETRAEGFEAGMQSEIGGESKKIIDSQLKSEDVSEEDVQKYKEDFFGGAVLGLAESVYPMMSPKMTAFFTTTFDDSYKDISQKAPDLTTGEKTTYSAVQGGIAVALERLGFRNLAASKSFMSSSTAKVFQKAVEKAGKVTPKAVKDVLEPTVKGFLSEFETGAAQEAASYGVNQTVNILKDKDIFEEKSWGQLGSDIIRAGGQEGIGGKIMSAPKVASNLIKTASAKDIKAAEANNVTIEDIKTELENLVNEGELTEEEASERLFEIESNTDAYNKIKELIPEDKLEEAIPIQKQYEAESEKLKNVSSALDPIVKEKIKKLQDQLLVLAGTEMEEGKVVTKQKESQATPLQERTTVEQYGDKKEVVIEESKKESFDDFRSRVYSEEYDKVDGYINKMNKNILLRARYEGVDIQDPVLASDFMEPSNTSMIPIDEIYEYKGEDRIGKDKMTDSRERIDKLKKDIKDNGLKEPLILSYENGDASIIEGNHRIEALKELGYKFIPVEIRTQPIPKNVKTKETPIFAKQQRGSYTFEDVGITNSKIQEGDKKKVDSKRTEDKVEKDKDVGTLSSIQEKYPDVTLDVFESKKSGTISLGKIEVPEAQRGEGIATNVMGDLIDYADANGLKITLTPSNEFGASKARLKEFYKRFGFIDNKGKNRDFSHKDDMYRNPEVVVYKSKETADGKKEIIEVKSGTHTSLNPIKIFKGLGGKLDLNGMRINAHKGVNGVFTTVDEDLAKEYAKDKGVSEIILPKGTTFEVIEVDGVGMTPSQYRAAEVKAINNSKADVVKLITVDGKIKAGTKKQEQYIIKNSELINELKSKQASKQNQESSGAKKPQQKQSTVKTATAETKKNNQEKENVKTEEGKKAEEIKAGDTVNATVDVYESGKKVSKRFKVDVTSVNEDGTFNLKRGKLIYKNIKPNKIAKINPRNVTSINKETEGLTYKEQVKQGVTELTDAIKNKSREKYNSAVSTFKNRITDINKKSKDFKERKTLITSFAKDLLNGLSKGGVKYIPTKKVNSILSTIERAKTDESLRKSVDKLIETTQNIAITQEEIDKAKKLKGDKIRAKKNLKTKLGQFSSEISDILAIKDIPNKLKPQYEKVLDNIGGSGAIINVDVNELLDLHKRLKDSLEVVDDIMTEEELKEPKDNTEDVENAVEAIKNIDSKAHTQFSSKEKRMAVLSFKEFKSDFLETLPSPTLKNIIKEIDNIDNGFISNGFLEALVIKNDGFTKAKNIESNKSFVTSANKFIDGVNSQKKADKVSTKALKRQLNHIDQVFGSIRNTSLYESLISPISRAFERSNNAIKSETKEIKPYIDKALASRKGMFRRGMGFMAEHQFKLNVLTDFYLLQKQAELNPDSNKVAEIEDLYNETINDYEKGGNKSGYMEGDIKAIKEVYKSVKDKDGNITAESINKYMTPAERRLIKFLEGKYKDNEDKFIYLSQQLRGETIDRIAGYAPRNSIQNNTPITSQDKLENAKKGVSKYVRASSTKGRTSKTPLVIYGGISNYMRYVKDINEDYNVSKAVREVDAAVSYLKKSKDQNQLKFAQALGMLVDEHVKKTYEQSESNDSIMSKFGNEMIRGVYSNMLISSIRLPAELLGNMITGATEFKNSYRYFIKEGFRESFNSVDIGNVFKNFGSVHEDRIGSNTVDLKDTESIDIGVGYKTASPSTAEGVLDFIRNNAAKNMSKGVNKMYYKIVDFAIPAVWKMEFVNEYNKITGDFISNEKLNDEEFIAKNKANIDNAIARADKHVSDMYNTASQFEKRYDAKTTNMFKKMVNFFMQAFTFNENSVIRSGTASMFGKGSMGQMEGAVKSSLAITRLFSYTFLIAVTKNIASHLMIEDEDDEDLEEMLTDSAIKGAADVGMIYLFGQKYAWYKTLLGSAGNMLQGLYEKYYDEKVLSTGDNIFFGNSFRTSRDAFRVFGPVGYLYSAIESPIRNIAKSLDKYAEGDNEEAKKYLRKANLEFTAILVLSSALGLPLVKEIKLLNMKYNKEIEDSKKKSTNNLKLKNKKLKLKTPTLK